ncbi:MAG: hypothetical protein ACJA1R_001949 [Flavobacteriales bacterium]|jgi:hypothetical protein
MTTRGSAAAGASLGVAVGVALSGTAACPSRCTVASSWRSGGVLLLWQATAALPESVTAMTARRMAGVLCRVFIGEL